MRYFQISNGQHGCLWDFSMALAVSSIKELAEGLKEHYNDVACLDYDDSGALDMTDAEALDWARQCWRSTGYLPISVDVGDDNYCVACNPCSPAEAKDINEAMA